MSKINLSNITKQIGITIKRKRPEILTGMGVGLGACTVVLAVKATPKALMLIEEKKREINHDILEEAKATGAEECQRIDKLTPIDTVRVAWKCYIPAAVTGLASVTCLVGANTTSARRNAALAAAYTLSETARIDYKKKVAEVVGEKKEREVRDAIAKDKIERNPVGNKEIIITEKGETRCYDSLSGRYFKSDIDMLNRSVNELNRKLIDQSYMSLNDYYYEIGLPEIKIGYKLGWRVDQGLVKLDFSSQLCDDGVPCVVVDFEEAPKYDFDMLI